MIVQITQARDELLLIKNLLPIWKKYADGFVFCLNDNTDDTRDYLESIKKQFNILEVIEHKSDDGKLVVETDRRQALLNTALKYSQKIICLDADEYLDGCVSKKQLDNLLEGDGNVLFYLNWIQYTNNSSIRIDGPWKNNIKDRIGFYKNPSKFPKAQKHSHHLPPGDKQIAIDLNYLFIAHLAWLDKTSAAVKQYYWKVDDYVNAKLHSIETYTIADYDASVNDFNWEESHFEYALKVDKNLFEHVNHSLNYKLKEIERLKRIHDIPNLGDWGYGIHDSSLYLKGLENYIVSLEHKLSQIAEIAK